jgi:hypothetical protein
MPDYAVKARGRTGTKYFDGSGKLIALDPAPRMTLLLRESFDTTTGVFIPKSMAQAYPSGDPNGFRAHLPHELRHAGRRQPDDHSDEGGVAVVLRLRRYSGHVRPGR